MRKTILTIYALCIACCYAVAQDNMEAFRHLSVGGEIGLHGLGVEMAMPAHRKIVFKVGYNWASNHDLFKTDIYVDTRDLREEQDRLAAQSNVPFDPEIGDTSIIRTGLQLGMNNIKVMVNWYPFSLGRFYLAGGVYYSFNRKDPFIRLSGYTTKDDWQAYKDICNRGHHFDEHGSNRDLFMALNIDGEDYNIEDRGSRGYFESDFVTSQFKYYLGMGLGRCVPNNRVGLQFEVGAMIYKSATLYCQDKEVGSIREASVAFGDDVKEILEYVDRYPVYPQVTMRLSFRML